MIELQRLLEKHTLARSEWMGWVDDYRQLIGAIGARLQALKIRCIPTDADRRASFLQAAHDIPAGPLFDIDADIAV